MVRRISNRRLIYWVIGFILLTTASVKVLIPSIEIERSDPYVRQVTRAVGAFHTVYGRYPELLTDAAPYLEKGNILHLGGNDYKVEIDDDGKVYVLESRYRVDQHGVMEELYARVIDKRRR
jgi:hypothetical protein